MLTEIIVLGIVITLSAWWSFITNKNKNFHKNFPGPPPVPLFGNTYEIKSTEDVLDVLMAYTKKYGGLFTLHAGPIQKSLIVSDYKFLEYLLSSTRILKKTDDYDYFLSWLGTGLLLSTGEKWKTHRRLLTPAFHFQILQQFLETFDSSGNILVQKLKEQVGNSSLDIFPFITLHTLDIICETAMGTKINAQEDGDSVYVQSVQTLCRIAFWRSFSLIQRSDYTYPLSKSYYTEKKALKIIHDHTNAVIDKKRKELEDSKRTKDEKRKKVFLDLLLEGTVNGRPLIQEEIREEVDTFMFEGHDTTASAISFSLFCLANYPDVQARVLEEQISLFGDITNDFIPTYADLQNMKYLEQVIKETLRLYPSVPIYGRKTTEPVEFNGTIIPKDVTLTVFCYGMHRNPEYFPNPDRFDPGRFDMVDGTLPYSYIPFSAGPRNCIGQKFAMLEMKSTISKIVRQFELLPAMPEYQLKVKVETVLKSVNGIKIGLKLRQM